MQQYHDLMRHVLEHGAKKEDRTGTGTLSVFGYQMRFNLSQGFPLLTTKKLHIRSIVHELLWFLRGEDSAQYLKDHEVKIWDPWCAGPEAHLGPIYGVQWRKWPARETDKATDKGRTIDQIQGVIDEIRRNPRLSPTGRQRVERRSDRKYEAASLPLPIPILCLWGKVVLPTISAQCGHLHRRSI